MNASLRLATAACAVAATLVSVSAATAAIHTYSAILTQGQEIPTPVPTKAIGMASVKYDDATGQFNYGVSWWGLSGPPTAAHFHGPATPTATASPVVNIGSLSGLASPSVLGGPGITLTPGQGADLLNNLWYVNVHTALNGPGEIRGQLRKAGSTQLNPHIPENPNGGTSGRGVFVFTNPDGTTGQWYDPIAADAFLFQTTDGISNFTAVMLPSIVPDTNNSYLVNSVHGSFPVAPGGTFTFPTPVNNFTISDIDPAVDGENPIAFPTFLVFDQQQVSFSMTPLPEPAATLALAPLALAAVARRRCRRD